MIAGPESIAVGSLAFVDKVKSELGVRATHRDVVEVEGTYALREAAEAYGLSFAAENEKLCVAQTEAGCTDRVHRVDTGLL